MFHEIQIFFYHNLNFLFDIFLTRICLYCWGHRKLGRCVIQLSKFLNHTLATHNQVDSFFENINHNDGKGAFTLTLFEMTITDCPGFHVPHCTYYEYTSYEFVCTICTNILKIILTARMSLKTTIECF
jgi:hypothetical protein